MDYKRSHYETCNLKLKVENENISEDEIPYWYNLESPLELWVTSNLPHTKRSNSNDLNDSIDVKYYECIYPVNEKGEERWPQWDEVKHMFDGLDIEILRRKFKDHDESTFKQWFIQGLEILKRCHEDIKPYNGNEMTSRLYFGYVPQNEIDAKNRLMFDRYYGKTTNDMATRHAGHVASWQNGGEKRNYHNL